MDLHPTPYPVRSQNMKPRPTRKISEPSKINAKVGPLIHRERRTFGTVRNPNIPLKAVPEKPAKVKPTYGLLKKATKPPQATRSPIIRRRRTIVAAEKPPEKTLARPKKKSVCFQEKEVGGNGKKSDEDATEPCTPLNAIISKPSVVTPYHSAEKCSKCRFDKLETASYWLSQIKVSESVGRHPVSAAFFGLALDCNAEPVRNLRVEVKKYLVRHEHLNEEEEWRKISVSYGLINGEGDKGGRGRSECKCSQPQS